MADQDGCRSKMITSFPRRGRHIMLSERPPPLHLATNLSNALSMNDEHSKTNHFCPFKGVVSLGILPFSNKTKLQYLYLFTKQYYSIKRKKSTKF